MMMMMMTTTTKTTTTITSEYTYITHETQHGTIIIFCHVHIFQSVLQYISVSMPVL
jgi:hypothetical protein